MPFSVYAAIFSIIYIILSQEILLIALAARDNRLRKSIPVKKGGWCFLLFNSINIDESLILFSEAKYMV